MSQSGLHSVKKGNRTKEEIDFEAERLQKFEALMEKVGQDSSLETIQSILELNPEFYTMWNKRRQVLRLDRDRIPSELPLIDKLLRINPKSYWIWNHRRWVLENSAEPMWEREVKLLKMMLDLDPRNFHGWDYRRYVMEKSGISSPLQEFEYTTCKIEQNFSNFSAWHYRSKLLTKAFPDKVSLEAQILNDLEFVRNAIFTEPADQSAWLYQRFLLGNDVEPVLLLNVLFGITGDSKLLVLKFNQKVKYVKSGIFSEIHIIKLESSNVEVIFELGAFHGNILGLASGKITFPLPTTTVNNSKFTTIEFMQLKGGTPTSELSKQPDSIWIQELSHIEELVEVEPDSKWALLTLLEFYQHLNKDSKVVLELLERLSTIDPFRKGYYNDIRSDIMLKTKLLEVPGNGDYINLSGMGLSRLQPHLPFVTATEINLSNNSLSKIDFSYFISVKKLYLDNNRMACLDGIDHLKDLQELYIQNNRNIRLNA